jgi:hypothetical protein
VVLGSQLFNHRKPFSDRPGYPIGPGSIIVAFTLLSYDLLDGMHSFNSTQKDQSPHWKMKLGMVRNSLTHPESSVTPLQNLVTLSKCPLYSDTPGRF